MNFFRSNFPVVHVVFLLSPCALIVLPPWYQARHQYHPSSGNSPAPLWPEQVLVCTVSQRSSPGHQDSSARGEGLTYYVRLSGLNWYQNIETLKPDRDTDQRLNKPRDISLTLTDPLPFFLSVIFNELVAAAAPIGIFLARRRVTVSSEREVVYWYCTAWQEKSLFKGMIQDTYI